MISAKEAREYCNPTCEELCAYLRRCVTASAQNGTHSCTIWDPPFSNWLVLGYIQLPVASRECIDKLKSLGFTLETVYRGNKLQEPGLKVSWAI